MAAEKDGAAEDQDLHRRAPWSGCHHATIAAPLFSVVRGPNRGFAWALRCDARRGGSCDPPRRMTTVLSVTFAPWVQRRFAFLTFVRLGDRNAGLRVLDVLCRRAIQDRAARLAQRRGRPLLHRLLARAIDVHLAINLGDPLGRDPVVLPALILGELDRVAVDVVDRC